MSHEIERRVLSSKVEVRSKGEDGTGTITGVAAVFNSLSEDLGGFREQIHPEAFAESLERGDDVLARAEHDSRMLLGRRSSGTLRLSVDGHGLNYEVDLPDTQAARDLSTLIKRGDVSQSSFAFYIRDHENDQTWETTADGMLLRTILKASLVDVAPVAEPAYKATQVSARTLEQAREKAKAPEPPPAEPEAGVPNEINEARLRLAAL